MNLFNASFMYDLFFSFQQNLVVIKQEIDQRNAAIIACNKENDIQEYPYEWLLPENVVNSISI